MVTGFMWGRSPIVKPANVQTGMSLIWVLVLSTALSLALIQYSYEVKIKNERVAFQFTLSQIHSVLNMAYKYRLERGVWPRDYRGDCEMPDQFLDNALGFPILYNGWGYQIEGVEDCDDLGDRYAIEQIVPEKYLSRFSGLLGEDVSGSTSGVASNMIRMQIVFDESMANNKIINLGKLQRSASFALRFDEMVCSDGRSANYLVALDAACGMAKDKSGDGVVAPDPIFDGVSMGVLAQSGQVQVDYRMFVEGAYGVDSLYDDNGEAIFDDGFMYADEGCPVSQPGYRYAIDAALLAWCE